MKLQIDEELIKEMYPEVVWIQNKEMQKACVQALIDAYLYGRWTCETIEKIPVSVKKVKDKERNNLISHVRTVTKIAVSIYDHLNEAYDLKSCSRDIVIAGALLHDLGKMVEFELDVDGNYTYSSVAQMLRHPVLGVLIADKNHMQPEVLHIISTHSFEGNESYKTLAAQIVRAADTIAFDCLLTLEAESL